MIRSLATLSILWFMNPALAEEPIDPRITPEVLDAFEARTFEDQGFSLPYRIVTPELAGPDDKRPLLLFLHGFGERGDDNQRQLIHGGSLFASPEFRERHRAFVVAPQCPNENLPDSKKPVIWSLWLRPTDQAPDVRIDREPSQTMQAAKRLVEHLVETEAVDPDRLYVAGLSMGGYGTWEMAARDPGYWAAAAPICGGGAPAWADRLEGLPLWAFHGDADGAVPVERSRDMVAAIQSAGGRPIYTEYPGVGHDSWTPTFEARHVWDWLFAQRR